MAKQYVYEIGGKLYANLTNRCSNACTFCVRNYDADRKKPHGYEGYDLWLEKEPSAEEVIEALEKYDLTKFKEVVFCGYGEPTYRFDELEKVAEFAHKKGLRTRINTNGQANAILGKDVSERLCKAIDVIGISLNQVTPEKYDAICRSIFGLKAFDIMLDFAKLCVSHGGNVIFSVVDCIGKEDIKKAEEIAKAVGAKLRVREMIDE